MGSAKGPIALKKPEAGATGIGCVIFSDRYSEFDSRYIIRNKRRL